MSQDCDCLRCTTERLQRQPAGAAARGKLFGYPVEGMRMFLCAVCGNKRCPHSDDHRNACTGSNLSGQTGSRYA